ncbi:UNVERIFIED_CONTAM: hypothetical protein GTU68_004974 [Idotea baltica]|nr:hypothetical protein [Idotea baltica]
MAYRNDKVALIILDGWGKGRIKKADAIAHANTPFINSLYQNYPSAELVTYGEAVGLPNGQMGNSEVGHLNIGAGRIVYQDLLKINKAIADNTLCSKQVLLDSVTYAKANNCKIHLIGLVSDGGVHSHTNHLKSLIDFYDEQGLQNVFIHAFTDGRDTAPKGGFNYIKEVIDYTHNKTAEVATICGRYYAMDRDKRWERVKLAYDLLVNAKGYETNDLLNAIELSYNNDVTDEFIKPIVNTNFEAKIDANDVVLCFNFRTDRCREITTILTQQDFAELDIKTIPLHYITMTEYDSNFKNVKVIFEDDTLKNTLGEILEQNNKTQLRCAETEKYPHVTFFFSGGKEEQFNGEERILVSSPKVATYDLQAEMSAPELAQKTANYIETNKPDYVCLNFANPDMVGHTGVFEAVVKAVESTDKAAKLVVETARKNGYSIIIIADHGNADYLINKDGTPHTAHTKNPVPILFIDDKYKGNIKSGKLGDIAPTVLNILGINIPEEMDGNYLLTKTKPKKVLLVNDDINALETAWALVAKKGFNCSTAFTNKTYNEQNFDFIFIGDAVNNLQELTTTLSA